MYETRGYDIRTNDTTIFGFLRKDLIDGKDCCQREGAEQKIESAAVAMVVLRLLLGRKHYTGNIPLGNGAHKANGLSTKLAKHDVE